MKNKKFQNNLCNGWSIRIGQVNLVLNKTTISQLQMSGLGLGALALWTYLGQHGAFIVVIPSYTYQLIVVLTLATACLILINALIGLVGVKLQWKCIICLVITLCTMH